MNTITITVQAETEEDLYPILNHAFREVTEIDYKNFHIENSGRPMGDWFEITGDKLKGRYKWAKVKK